MIQVQITAFASSEVHVGVFYCQAYIFVTPDRLRYPKMSLTTSISIYLIFMYMYCTLCILTCIITAFVVIAQFGSIN